MNNSPKILMLDIETAPISAHVWGLWKNNVGLNQIDNDWYILTWAAKWLGGEDVYYDALPYHDTYKKEPENDICLLENLAPLLEEADVVVAHNGKHFDIPKINARFLLQGISPPSPFKINDTLQVARKNFNLTSNKLDYLAQHLLGEGKDKHADFIGHDLWMACIKGNKKAWKEMIDYNVKDVDLLERVYLALRPWDKQAANYGLYLEDTKPVCPKCGGAMRKDGFHYTSVSKFQAYRCKDCGGWARGRKNLLPKEVRDSLVTNIAG